MVLSGTNMFDGGTVVEAGTLVVDNSAALADGSDFIVGDSSLFSPFTGSPVVVGGPQEADLPVAPVPEPGTLALLAMGAGPLLTLAAGDRGTERASIAKTKAVKGCPIAYLMSAADLDYRWIAHRPKGPAMSPEEI